MKKGSIYFLKGVIVLMSLIVLALCIFALPSIGKSMIEEFPTIPNAPYFVLAFYASAVPFFIALVHAWRMLIYIDKNIAFSPLSVKALKKIKYCAVLITLFLLANMPLMFHMAQADDAPGAIIIWGFISGAPLVIAVFAALLEKLLKNAIDFKSENELTV